MILKPAKIHLLDPGPLDPASNMALDEVLLESDGWWLRLTRWDRSCVTLGRFQSWPQNSSDESFPQIHPFSSSQFVSATQPSPTSSPGEIAESLPAVRRVTGGGSILHGEDLTIAIAGPCPSPHFPDRSPGKVATQISKVLGSLLSPGIHTRGGEDREKEMVDVVDCFQRRSPSDLVMEVDGETVKAGGLALAFRPGRVLIEGSLHRSPAARPVEEDRSWMELLMREWLGTEGETAEKWQTDLTDEQAERVSEAVENRFGTVEWNRR